MVELAEKGEVAYMLREEWMTPAEAAAYARVGQNSMRAAIRDGELPGYVVNGTVRVSSFDVSAWIRGHKPAKVNPFER